MFLGDRVTDEGYVQAMFAARASTPAAIEAARAVDAYSCIGNHIAEQSDVTSAYNQAFLQGTETWVSLPADRWPESWKGRYKAPVVKLVLNIYGHPEAGKTWEDAFEKHATECGFEKLQCMRSCFLHRSLKVFMVVYVDDIKMSGPAAGLEKVRKILKKRFTMDPPTTPDRFLGCYLEAFTTTIKHMMHVKNMSPETLLRGDTEPRPCILQDENRKVRGYSYNMEEYLRNCVNKYCKLTGAKE